MSIASDKSQKFADTFNTILKASGKTYAPVTDAQLATENTPAQAALVKQLMSTIHPPKAPKAKASSTKSKKAKVTAAPTPTTTARIADALKASKAVGEPGNITEGLGENHNGGILDNWWGAIQNTFTGHPLNAWDHEKKLLGAIANTPEIKRPLDLVSRPLYALADSAKQTTKAINEGEPLWSLGDDAGYGLWRGLSGKDKTGFGQVLEEASKYSSDDAPRALKEVPLLGDLPYGGTLLNHFQKDHPDIAKQVKRVVGGVTDFELDPVMHLHGGSVEKLKDASKLEPELAHLGEATGKEARVVAAGDAVAKAVKTTDLDKQYLKTPGFFASRPSEEVVRTVAEDTAKRLTEVQEGAQKGKITGISNAADTRLVANSATDKFQELTLKKSLERADRYAAGTMTASEEKFALKNDPYFKAYYDHLAGGGTENEARLALHRVFEPEGQLFYRQVAQNLENSVTRVPTLNILGTKIAELPNYGKVLDRGREALGSNQFVQGFNKAFNYSSNLPGEATNIRAFRNAEAHSGFNTIKAGIENLAKDIPKDEIKALEKHLAGNIPMSGPVENLRLALRDGYKQIDLDEAAAGLQSSSDILSHPDNYTYIKDKGQLDRKAWKSFKDQRKLDLMAGGVGASTEDAAKQGLHVETDPIKNYLARLSDSKSKIADQLIKKDIYSMYGSRAVLTDAAAKARGLEEFHPSTLADTGKQLKASLKPGEKLFIDKDINQVLDNISKLTDIHGSEDASAMVHALDYVTKKFKILNTIYWPAFHVKNLLSDMMFGLFDGVKTRDYADIINGFLKKNTTNLDIAGHDIPFNDFLEKFKQTAAGGGQMTAELDNALNVSNKIRQGSEFREDVGRMTHFYHAMKEEVSTLMKKGRTFDEAYEEAVKSATTRVNKYKFDYNALTRVEQKYVRRGMPFYTYIRKAMPTIIEAMWRSPKYLSIVNRIQNNLDPKMALLPDYLKDQESIKILSGSEPWVATNDITPSATLNDAINPLHLAAKLSPIVQVPFEAATGKNAFTGGKSTSLNVSTNSDFNQILGAVADTNRLTGTLSSKAPGWERIYALAGLPIKKVTTARQEQKAKEIYQQLTDQITSLNTDLKQKGYSMYKAYPSNAKAGLTLKIKDQAGNVIGVYTSIKDLETAVRKLEGS